MTSEPAGDRTFATTRWSVVLAAGGPVGDEARTALDTLCRAYWYPLYADARRRGASMHDAADLVQGFFAVLMEKDWVAAANRERGRFRAFLLTAFRRHAGHERDKSNAEKRGGGALVQLDLDAAESRLSMEPAHTITPERAFERRFALALLARVLDRVKAERPSDADLMPLLGGAGDVRSYADIAKSRGSTEAAVKVAVHRLRARYREILRAEIRETVAEDADVDDEIRHLLDVVAG